MLSACRYARCWLQVGDEELFELRLEGAVDSVVAQTVDLDLLPSRKPPRESARAAAVGTTEV